MPGFFQVFVLLISDLLQMIIQGAFVLLIFNKKIEWKNLLVFALIATLVNGTARNVLPQNLAIVSLIIFIIVMVLSLKFILKLKYLHSILGTCIVILASAVIEYTTMAIAKMSFQDRFDALLWAKSFIHTVAMRNTGTVFYIAITLLIYYLKIKINIPEDINKKRKFGILFNGLLTVILIVPNIIFFENTTTKTPAGIIVFNFASALVLLFLSVYNTIKSGELEFKKQEVEFQKLYIKTLNDLIDGLRGFKHDFNNMVQVMQGYLSLNDIDGLKRYFSQLQCESKIINSIIPLNSYVKDNPPVYGLLLSKLTYSEMKNIMFDINILSEINIGSMKIYDFCKVIGILLDNALEAAAETEKRYVEFCMKDNRDETGSVIDISNSFLCEVDTEKIYKNGYTTKQGHSGFGLWEVKKILLKYKNCLMKTSVSGNILTQHIEILR